jgi:hypothetical protein
MSCSTVETGAKPDRKKLAERFNEKNIANFSIDLGKIGT